MKAPKPGSDDSGDRKGGRALQRLQQFEQERGLKQTKANVQEGDVDASRSASRNRVAKKGRKKRA